VSVVRLYQFAPGGGYDPYNSAVTHHAIGSRLIERDLIEVRKLAQKIRAQERERMNAAVDALIRRGFKYLANKTFGKFVTTRPFDPEATLPR
jgi:hypothetical protein